VKTRQGTLETWSFTHFQQRSTTTMTTGVGMMKTALCLRWKASPSGPRRQPNPNNSNNHIRTNSNNMIRPHLALLVPTHQRNRFHTAGSSCANLLQRNKKHQSQMYRRRNSVWCLWPRQLPRHMFPTQLNNVQHPVVGMREREGRLRLRE
jgi:hypothetical protein